MKKYEIRTRTSVRLISAEPVDLQYGVKAIVHQALDGRLRFAVSEITTGFNIAYGLTKEIATKGARKALRKKGKKETQGAIKNALKEYGEINQEWQEVSE